LSRPGWSLRLFDALVARRVQWWTPARRVAALLLPLLLMAAIFFVSSLPSVPRPEAANPFDYVPPALNNLLHIPAFGLLTLLWLRGVEALGCGPRARYFCAPGIAFLFGVFDEWHQLSVPGRYGSILGVGFNLLGILLVLSLCAWAERRRGAPSSV